MKIAGIDYSLTCPAITILDGESWKSHFLIADRKFHITTDRFCGEGIDWSKEQERFHKISEWSMKCLVGVDHVFIENYAFQAVGRITGIAENCGLLKHKLWMASIPFDVIAPATIKKFGTGSGRADKKMMIESFNKNTGIDLYKFFCVKKECSPISDIADSYWIARQGQSRLLKR